MIGIRRALVTTIVSLALFLSAARAGAQDKWPSRPVTLVVPVGAGTITDVAGRLLADYLKEAFGQPFVIENKPGAGATLGARSVARAQPDGYTFLVGGNTTHSSVPVAVQERTVRSGNRFHRRGACRHARPVPEHEHRSSRSRPSRTWWLSPGPIPASCPTVTATPAPRSSGRRSSTSSGSTSSAFPIPAIRQR